MRKEENMGWVFVRTYVRWRFGREEHVRAHTRRWPNQLDFGF
jgi:hypothetical protein